MAFWLNFTTAYRTCIFHDRPNYTFVIQCNYYVINMHIYCIFMLCRYLTATTTFVSGVGYIFAKDTFKLLKQRQKF